MRQQLRTKSNVDGAGMGLRRAAGMNHMKTSVGLVCLAGAVCRQILGCLKFLPDLGTMHACPTVLLSKCNRHQLTAPLPMWTVLWFLPGFMYGCLL
jgi:hypothetical protein